MASSYSHLQVDSYPGRPSVIRLTLNRPETGNAMNDVTLTELADAFSGFSKQKGLRAVVVRGAGKHFCAGADIEWMRRAGKLRGAAARKDAMKLAQMCRAVEDCPVPVLARAHGAVYGGGLGLVAACDIVLAEENARMSFSECRLGILPAVVSTVVLPKIGAAAARRYYLTAEVFGMAAARELGLVHESVPEAGLDARIDSFLDCILKNGPLAVREAKALIAKLGPRDRDARVKLTVATLLRVRSSAEGQEGLSAFLEKRPASWAKP